MVSRFSLPDALKPLESIAMNLWFSWNPDARDLFKSMDLELWRKVERNPVAFLQQISAETLQQFEKNTSFIDELNRVYQRLTGYLNQDDTLFRKNYTHLREQWVAYFSAEYGIHESLPNYAGGLGILAGDHCKTASDLGLPFVAVGLMYKHAYFDQTIDAEGKQQEHYKTLNPEELPVTLVKDEEDKPLLVSVPILDREVFIRIWEAKVGRISLYLLDTDVEDNKEDDRTIIHSLYGGTRDTRIKQEIVLGIGGLRVLRKLGYQPAVFHMNEGHSAFLGLERLYELMNEGMNFKMALEYVRATSLFTTHTPIPAGNEAFEFDMIERYFKNFWPQLEMSDDFFFELGRNINEHQHANFSLTVLALNLSHMANGVSALHGEVSRKMWQRVYPGIPVSEVPIGHVTNGIHTESWLNREMIRLFDRYVGEDWRDHILDEHYWDKIKEAPEDVFWQAMQTMKKDMADHLRRLYALQLERLQGNKHDFPAAENILNEESLTIGFARRFAPYKRATLIFSDLERLKKLLNDEDRPLQIIFSGKAHPHNDAGKELIRTINHYARQEGLKGKILFMENYGIDIGRSLVSGVDLWLNNPRRPLEASGTSGQKVPINGGVNFSVLDGWWPEAYNGQNGWVIGSDLELSDPNRQDQEDADALYDILENKILPLYYDRDKSGIPRQWLQVARESLRSVISRFSTHRMVWNYIEQYYVPGMKRCLRYKENDYAELFRFSRWQNRIQRHWHKMSLYVKNGNGIEEDQRIFSPGEAKEITVLVNAQQIEPEDLRVEITLERQDSIQGAQHVEIYPMGLVNRTNGDSFEYRAVVKAKNDGSYRLNCRVIPTHEDFINKHESRLIHWLD